ncbi:MAG TPA: M10 family metallopeptidase C-terminal domain-containing protein [Microvirga sp.]|jgi:Ca2+-binding RTX toxin-like protein|nr:M10 family metallopeptidase C-terminal domain-containing protein [Microvirga sp.]
MPVISSDTTTTDAGDNTVDLANGDYAYVLSTRTVLAAGAGAVGISGLGGNRVEIYGNVFSTYSTGVLLSADGAPPDGYNSVAIGNTGIVSAHSYGIQIFGEGNVIFNEGTVRSFEADGIYLTGGGNEVVTSGQVLASGSGIIAKGSANHIVNSGQITAAREAILVEGRDNRIVNTGTVTATGGAGSHGISVISEAGATNSVVNTGSILAGVIGLIGGAGSERVVNSGSITGNVVLGAGRDTFNGSEGLIVGRVWGGEGADRLIGGRSDDVLLGGEGNDDLRGGDGEDVLAGGTGNNLMSGGSGEDMFVFSALGDTVARSSITDFSSGVDILNLRAIDADALSPGNQAFSYRGDTFTGRPGDLIARSYQGTTLIEADVDGDEKADLLIYLSRTDAVLKSDFLL